VPGCNGFGIFLQDSLFRQIAYLSIIHCNLQAEFRILQLGQTLAKPIRVLQSFHPVRTLVRWNVVAAQRSNRFVSDFRSIDKRDFGEKRVPVFAKSISHDLFWMLGAEPRRQRQSREGVCPI
jgi:hypothetical protein